MILEQLSLSDCEGNKRSNESTKVVFVHSLPHSCLYEVCGGESWFNLRRAT